MMPNEETPIPTKDALVSFGLFADTHYAAGLTYGNRYCDESLEKLRTCVRTFNERKLPFAVNLGDLVDHVDDRTKETECLSQVASVLSEFRGECHSVLGNHDITCFTKQTIRSLLGGYQDSFYSFDRPGCHFVVLDSNYHQDGADYTPDTMPEHWADSWISAAQLDWLRQDLATSKSSPTVVFCHSNMDEREYDGNLDPHVLRNHAEARHIVEQSGNVVAVIQGHYHHGRSASINGIPYITLPAMVDGAGPENNAYAIASLYPDGKMTVEGYGRMASS